MMKEWLAGTEATWMDDGRSTSSLHNVPSLSCRHVVADMVRKRAEQSVRQQTAKDELAHPVDTSRTNLASALGFRGRR
jgi:hypothetical protein